MISLTIETLVLVAAWEVPFVFQGCFMISNKQDLSKQLLIFRCECHLAEKMDILDLGFSPEDYKFTHLHSRQSAIRLESLDNALNQALYLLKYALHATVEKLIVNPKQDLTYIDEVAMSGISKKMEDYLASHAEKNVDDDIGFAVSIDFTPTEESGQMAALALLGINKTI